MQHKELMNGLADLLVDSGAIRSPTVESAFRNVPRHLFLPATPLDQTYRDQAVTTKRSKSGQAISSSTQPSLMAGMLEQLQLEPGHRVLEIGAGTGYNAALMAHIVGDSGAVVSLDVDDDIANAARRHLEKADFGRVQIVQGDGVHGHEQSAPYDRIILTVGAHDIAPAWSEQLAPGGRIVMPFVLRARQKSIAFDDIDGILTSTSLRGGIVFMALRDTPTASENVIPLAENNSLIAEMEHADTVEPQVMLEALDRIDIDWPTGIWISSGEQISDLATWLELHDPNFCHFYAGDLTSTKDLIPRLNEDESYHFTFGIHKDSSLALLSRGSVTPDSDASPDDLDNTAFPLVIQGANNRQYLVDHLCHQIKRWNDAGRPGDRQLRIRAYPSGEEPVQSISEPTVDVQKQWTRLLCDWPE